MTNYEYFKDEIIELLVSGREMAVEDDKPIACKDTSCCRCDLYGKNPPLISCEPAVKAWLNAEHIEKPKLTKKERMFCELYGIGWIAMDADGTIWWHNNKPSNNGCAWISSGRSYANISTLPDINFSFITWDDEEPWSVEDLLKLEVEEEG
jgi:hypothetical protein